MKKDFLILGNGYSGSSLLHSLINSNDEVNVEFEKFQWRDKSIEKWKHEWEKLKNEEKLIWGNKIPIELFILSEAKKQDITSLIDDYFIIWLTRKFSGYYKSILKRGKIKNSYGAKKIWEFAQSCYFIMREKRPDKILNVSFEELVIYPERELFRICDFLGIHYNIAMLQGAKKIFAYPGNNIMKEKAFV